MSAACRDAASAPDRPLISVVVASVNGWSVLADCLAALCNQEWEFASEIVVVDCTEAATRAAVRRHFPQVRLIEVEGRPAIPALRALGIARVRGHVIALTEDHCVPQHDWFRRIARSHQAGYQAVGGAVENGCAGRLVDRAAFFCEYAGFTRPLRAGAAAALPGNNCAYDRRVLGAVDPEFLREAWEPFLHARLRRQGVHFHCDPEMVVWHKRSTGLGTFLAQRYHYSRAFAGLRLRGAGWWQRGANAGATLLLPPLLLARMAAVARRKRQWGEFLLTLPVLVPLVVIWALGEAAGALLGPGRSMERVT